MSRFNSPSKALKFLNRSIALNNSTINNNKVRCLVTDSEQAILNRASKGKGIARISDSKFEVPSINTKRNVDRYILSTRILKSHFKNALGPFVGQQLESEMNRLLSGFDSYLQNNPKLFCELVASYGTWFKLFILSGIREQGVVKDYF